MALGIQPESGAFVGAHKRHRRIPSNDTLLLYGQIATLQNLDKQKQDQNGDREHQQAVANHKEVIREEDQTNKEDTNPSHPA